MDAPLVPPPLPPPLLPLLLLLCSIESPNVNVCLGSQAFGPGGTLHRGHPHLRQRQDGVPSVSLLASAPLSGAREGRRLLVCLVSGCESPPTVLWWSDDEPLTPPAMASGTWAGPDGEHGATEVWEVAGWPPASAASYACGTVQRGRVYRQTMRTQ